MFDPLFKTFLTKNEDAKIGKMNSMSEFSISKSGYAAVFMNILGKFF